MDWTCCFFWSLWWSLRVCGFLLNQLVALEGIISVKYPLYTATVFSSPCFIIYYILVFLFIIIGHIFVYEYYLLGTEHRWCEDPIESAPFIIRDRAPMVQRTLLNLLRLLGPKPERRRALLFSSGFFFFFFFFIDYPGIFGGLNMVKNS